MPLFRRISMTNRNESRSAPSRSIGVSSILVALALAFAVFPVTSPALAAATCVFVPEPDSVVNVNLPLDGDGVTMSVDADDKFVVIGTGLASTDCGGATTANVNSVSVIGGNGNQRLTLDLRDGPFEPGDEIEGPVGQVSEIEFNINLGNDNAGTTGDKLEVLGPPDDDILGPCAGTTSYTFGTSGVNLNGDLDAELVVSDDSSGDSVDLYSAVGNDRLDTFSGEGGIGTGAILATPLLASGKACDDTLKGGTGADTLQGGEGDDIIDGSSSSNDTVDFSDFVQGTPLGGSPEAGVSVNLSNAGQQDTRQGLDTITNIENIIGSNASVSGSSLVGDTLTGNTANNNISGLAGTDSITGSDGNDILEGGFGADAITPGPGNDTVNGGIIGSPGTDTSLSDSVSYAGAAGAGVTVDLAIATPQAIGADQGTDTISEIENATGSAQNDTLKGNQNNNSLTGGAGNDTLEGRNGNDSLTGGDGNDSLEGGTGNDTFTPGPGNDVLTGGLLSAPGTDPLGVDTVTYKDASSTACGENANGQAEFCGVTVDLAVTTSQNVGSNQGFDTLKEIENLNGSLYNDTIDGNSAPNVIVGADGDDIINGRSGNDTIKPGGPGGSDGRLENRNQPSANGQQSVTGDLPNPNPDDDLVSGGAGNDTVDYTDAGGVVVDLADGTATSDREAFDTLVGFENVIGSTGNDTLSGNGSPNILTGLIGNDQIEGRGGNDTVIPGQGNDTSTGAELSDPTADPTGVDTISFVGSPRGVTVDLSASQPQQTGEDPIGNPQTTSEDTISAFENLIGSAFNDSLTGTEGANSITGSDGNDTINGDAGSDLLDGGNGTDNLNGGAGADILNGGPDNDILNGGADNDIENGQDGNDKFLQEAAANGADQLNGGTGADVADYSARTAFVNVTPDSVADDGQAGELDNIGSDVEEVLVGPRRLTPLSTPARILDTRTGPGTPVGPGQTIEVQITGQGGVPTSTVSAVAMNVTVTGPTAPSHLTVWPKGAAQPTTSNLNYVAGQTVPNFLMVKVGDEGKVLVNNNSGTVHVIFDVAGWYSDPTVLVTGGELQTLTPARILDTRDGTGGFSAPIGPNSTITVQVSGQGGVPASSNVSAIAMNVTVTGPTAAGDLRLWPTGVARPNSSNVNFVPGQTVANFAVVKLGTSGRVDIYNAGSGTVHVILDVAGWYATADLGQGDFQSMRPSRILDTRYGTGGFSGALAPGQTIDVQVNGTGGVPLVGATAAAMNVTITEPTQAGHLTVWPKGDAQPNASNLNWAAGQTVPNFTVVKVGPDGKVSVYNGSGGTVHVIFDVAGWFTG